MTDGRKDRHHMTAKAALDRAAKTRRNSVSTVNRSYVEFSTASDATSKAKEILHAIHLNISVKLQSH